MNDFLNWLKSSNSNQLPGSLTLLLVGAAISLIGHILLGTYQGALVWLDRRRSTKEAAQHLREVIVDILIHADFDRKSVTAITDPARIAALKLQIERDPSGFRPFIAFDSHDPTFDDYRGIRRKLDLPLMVACDRFFDNSLLFLRYYEKIGSDEFLALSAIRKNNALDELCRIGGELGRSQARLVQAMQHSPIARSNLEEVQTLLLQMEVDDATP